MRFAYLGLFSVTNASIPGESKIIILAFAESIGCQIGPIKSIRFSKTNCKLGKRSCLRRVILEASGTLAKPQKPLKCLEYCRKTSNRESVGMKKMPWL